MPLLQKRQFTAGTSFTLNALTRLVKFTLKAGGGGGGGGSTSGAGGGGAEGGYAESTFVVEGGESVTYAIGALGAAGAAGAAGTAGGDTTVTFQGITVTTKGGNGGLAFGATQLVLGGAAQVSTNGNVNGAGQPGGCGVYWITPFTWRSGKGGGMLLCGGGNSVITAIDGNPGVGYGAGGSGGGRGSVAGGAGTAGVLIVEEFS